MYQLDGGDCLLENQVDFETMVYLCSTDRINARIQDSKACTLSNFGVRHDDEDGGFMQIDYSSNNRDQLEKFYSEPKTTYLTEKWVSLIDGVGQEFQGGVKEFRDNLARYAVEQGFEYKFLKNDTYRVTARCVIVDYDWHIHAILNRTNGIFHIKKFQREHKCGSTYRAKNHKRVTSRLIADEIAGMINKKPRTSPTELIDLFTDKYGLDMGYHTAWLGVEKARGEIYGDISASFDKLRWYVDAVRISNPGSILKLEYDPVTKEFSRFFVAFDACIKGFNHCRPLLCLDAAHLKDRFKGWLLAATGKDANQGLFPLAYAVCDSENDTNWSWFLGLLRSALSNRPITFITNRNGGLVNNIPILFPECHHAFCLYHLQWNLKDHFPGRYKKGFRKRLVELFNYCAYAPTVSAYKECEEQFFSWGGDKAKTFIATIPKENWANAYFGGQRYGEMSSSAVESFNNWVLKLRHLPVLHLVDEIRIKIMKQMAARRAKSETLNSVLCPEMDKRLQCTIQRGRAWRIVMSKPGLYELRVKFPKIVSVEERSCSCGRWQSTGFPCRHAITVIIKAGGGEGNLPDHIDPFYFVDAFRGTYGEPIYPVSEIDIPDFTKEGDPVIKPPRNKRPPGRPKVKRIKSRGEVTYRRRLRCSRCHKIDKHNRRTCTEPSNC